MSLRQGAAFLESLRDGREVWLDGERVKDVTAHPQLRGTALTIAELYAMQHRPDRRDQWSFVLDESGSTSSSPSRGCWRLCAAQRLGPGDVVSPLAAGQARIAVSRLFR